MPLAFGAILGGTTTLVGTPPNILAAQILAERGLEPFELFDFTPMGFAILALGVLYMLTVGRKLLPVRSVRGPALAGGRRPGPGLSAPGAAVLDPHPRGLAAPRPVAGRDPAGQHPGSQGRRHPPRRPQEPGPRGFHPAAGRRRAAGRRLGRRRPGAPAAAGRRGRGGGRPRAAGPETRGRRHPPAPRRRLAAGRPGAGRAALPRPLRSRGGRHPARRGGAAGAAGSRPSSSRTTPSWPSAPGIRSKSSPPGGLRRRGGRAVGGRGAPGPALLDPRP